VAQVLRSLVHHETAALHPDGVAAVEVRVQVGTVAHALMVPTLEIPVLVENDLRTFVEKRINYGRSMLTNILKITIFTVRTHNKLTFPIVSSLGARLALNRRSPRRCPFI